MGKVILFAAVCVMLAGCSTTRTGSLCTAGPIILSQDATTRLTRSEKEQIVTLNESGEKLCGWKP